MTILYLRQRISFLVRLRNATQEDLLIHGRVPEAMAQSMACMAQSAYSNVLRSPDSYPVARQSGWEPSSHRPLGCKLMSRCNIQPHMKRGCFAKQL